MSEKRLSDSSLVRTWIELDARAAEKNYRIFRNLIGKKVKLWSVVKSNAYGHGLYAFSRLAEGLGVDGFCVDSVVEGISLRKSGIKKPILVLGPTLASRYPDAARHSIAITVSSREALAALAREKHPPAFHLKIDTGMHRQGFFPEEIPAVAAFLRGNPAAKRALRGIYTHFAAAKDTKDTRYTDAQIEKFLAAAETLESSGFRGLIRHAAATGGTLLGKKYHLDAVRIGIGLHGVWPSSELKKQLASRIALAPTLSWKTVVSEVKQLKKGEGVGYDLTERAPRDMTMAVLPVGYWHGFSRALSGHGRVIMRGKKEKVLGRVSMDLTVVSAPKGARPGDVVTLIGGAGHAHISADELAERSGTTAYEFLTRLNPLMEKVVLNRRKK